MSGAWYLTFRANVGFILDKKIQYWIYLLHIIVFLCYYKPAQIRGFLSWLVQES